MPVIYNNNAITTLNGAITNVATSITVTAGGVFPVTSAPDYCYLTITEGAKIEIIKVTDITGNVLTAVRGQDGTTGQAFGDLSRIDLRMTSITLADALSDNILSDAAIKTAYENNTDTNAYTDAAVTKLGNIETSADVTDTANVTAAGALMDSEIDLDLKSFVLPANTTITSFIQTLLDDANVTEARTTLGVDLAGTINYTHPNHTGDVTSVGDGSATIVNNAVTLAKMADMATASLLGRNTAGSGDPEVLSPATARGILNVENNADVTDAANVGAAGAVMDSDISAAEGMLRKSGAGSYEAIKSNIGAVVAPTVNEDSADGYTVGSVWIDTTGDKIYQAVDVTVGAAVWLDISAGGRALASQAEAEAGTENTKGMTPLRTSQTVEARVASGGIIQTDIANSAVGQAELKTTTGDMTRTGDSILFTGPGGEYGFWPTVKETTAFTSQYVCAVLSPMNHDGNTTSFVQLTTSFVQRFMLGVSTIGSRTITARQRYIQASPPYNMGDGDVFSFIFALVGTDGKIEATYHAPEPPWANNGPTNIRPDRVDKKTGKKYKKMISKMPDPLKLMEPDFLQEKEFELTAEYKNSDMGFLPHPWIGNDLGDKTVVLLDPMSDIVERLDKIREIGDDSSTLLYDDYVRIGNTELGRGRPNGVMSVSVKMK